MILNILPNSRTDNSLPATGRIATIAENGCLPGIIAGTFGWEAISLEFIDDKGKGTTFGACRIGPKIVMLPHFSYGPSPGPGVAQEVMKALLEKGYSCEWRLTEKVSEYTFTDKVVTLLPLLSDVDQQFSQLGTNLRRKIRKCASNGISVKKGKSELLPDFYETYSRNMHRLGSPALPYQWFANLLTQYNQGEAAIWCSYLDDKPVGTAFMLGYKGFYEACWFSTLTKYNRLYISYGLYWELIRCAVEQNGNHFSFGRSSSGSGVHKFKQQWGGVDMPLIWNYSHPQGNNIRKFTFLATLWKLLPYRVAQILGSVVAGRLY
ncbi:MAG: GNAT family N-acetyltransferase [Bacteroidota bacterium]